MQMAFGNFLKLRCISELDRNKRFFYINLIIVEEVAVMFFALLDRLCNDCLWLMIVRSDFLLGLIRYETEDTA